MKVHFSQITSLVSTTPLKVVLIELKGVVLIHNTCVAGSNIYVWYSDS